MKEKGENIMMDNHSVDETLDAAEGAFEIDLVNGMTGAIYACAPILATNTMEQILKEYAADIGVDPNYRWTEFKNRQTGQETLDKNATVGSLGLKTGDALVICGYCGGIA